MKKVFVDTSYLIAINFPGDQWHQKAIQARQRLGDDADLLASEVSLHEFLTSTAKGAAARDNGIQAVQRIFTHNTIEIIWQKQKWFEAGFALYRQRRDKAYSLQDCILMAIMYDMGIREILTSDRHFEQEGFIILIK